MTAQLNLSGRHVLLVEDEPRLREMLLRAIREMSFEATGAASAEQALRLLEQRPHPVIIVDLNLPAAGGMDLIRTVRKRWPPIQPIILTGFGDLDAARQAIHLDVVDFLTKPCALGDLELALDRAFRRLLKDHPTALASVEIDPDFEEDDESEGPEFREATNNQKGIDGILGRQEHAGAGEPARPAFEPRDANSAMSIEEVERRAILAVLDKHHGNRNAAAVELGISLRKLYYRLAQYQKQGSSSS